MPIEGHRVLKSSVSDWACRTRGHAGPTQFTELLRIENHIRNSLNTRSRLENRAGQRTVEDWISCEASEQSPWRQNSRTASTVHPAAWGPPWACSIVAISDALKPATARRTKMVRVKVGRLVSQFLTRARSRPASIVSNWSPEELTASRSSSSMHVD